jgi:hypothetical protein
MKKSGPNSSGRSGGILTTRGRNPSRRNPLRDEKATHPWARSDVLSTMMA